MLSQVQSFARDTAGGVALIFGITLVPLVGSVGVAVDYTRVATARTAAQTAADAAALAAASTRDKSEADLQRIATNYFNAAVAGSLASSAKVTKFNYRKTDRRVEVQAAGSLKSSFLAVLGIKTLSYDVTATAVRGVPGSTELVLVLDNTWSMNGAKLAALKAASTELVNMLTEDSNTDIKIGVVPYADYVNVGVHNRSQSWVSVPRDYSTTSERTCRTLTTKTSCKRTGATQYCTRKVDGIEEMYDCTPSQCKTENVPPYESCSGGGTRNYTWYGCVASRTKGDLRRHDAEPATPYPGLLATNQNCLNPIVPLTKSKSTVIKALDSMIVNVGGYRPQTYIPAGLIWGVNVLSPSQPFNEGDDYDASNRRPRKVLVLMTDGANTLRFDPKTGQHIAPSGGSSAAELAETYKDMQAICDYAKSRKIEVFTVAFDVTEAIAKAAMKSCATSPSHGFDASSRTELLAAFQKIASSLANVALTR